MKSKSPFPIPTEIEGLFRMLKMNSACERYRAIWAEPSTSHGALTKSSN